MLSIVDILYSITDGIVKKLLYTAVVSLVASEGVVNMLKLNFSKFELHMLITVFCLINNIHGRYICCSTL